MSEAAPAQALSGHNRGPIIAPSTADWLADLQRRYPEVATKLEAFEAAAAEYPDHIPLDQPEVAEAMQDLLLQMNKEKAVWEVHEKTEKGPWNDLVKVTTNFFSKSADAVGSKETAKKEGTGLIGKLGKVYKDYLDRKEAAARKAAEAELERQRKLAEQKAEEARVAEAARVEAERRAEEARQAEEESRRKEEEAKQRRLEEERKAEEAAAEQRRIETERRQKKQAEEIEFASIMASVKPLLKRATELHQVTEADEAKPADLETLDGLIKSGGVISTIAGPLNRMVYLDDDDVAKITSLRSALSEMRTAFDAHGNRRQKAQREKARLAEEKRDADERARREEERKAEEKKLADTKAEREKAQREADAAKEEAAAARDQINESKGARRDAAAEAHDLGKQEKSLGQEAERTQNRADRMGSRLDKAAPADFNQTRGYLGSVGGSRRQWVPLIQDMDALRASMGPLGPHVNEEAVSAAVTTFMRVHQGGFEGERVEGMLPGVIFTYEKDFQIR